MKNKTQQYIYMPTNLVNDPPVNFNNKLGDKFIHLWHLVGNTPML